MSQPGCRPTDRLRLPPGAGGGRGRGAAFFQLAAGSRQGCAGAACAWHAGSCAPAPHFSSSFLQSSLQRPDPCLPSLTYLPARWPLLSVNQPAPRPRPRPAPAQVRHYYYRLLKRLNKILGEGRRLDARNNLQAHKSMIKFWEVVSALRCAALRWGGCGACGGRAEWGW